MPVPNPTLLLPTRNGKLITLAEFKRQQNQPRTFWNKLKEFIRGYV